MWYEYLVTQIFNKKSQTPKRRLLRKNLPSAELVLWECLRNRKLNGEKFKRQFSISRYVVDFYCPQLNLAIEIDGKYHLATETVEYDKDRQEVIESLGINMLRFTNKEVLENIEKIISRINSFSISLRRRGIKGEVK